MKKTTCPICGNQAEYQSWDKGLGEFYECSSCGKYVFEYGFLKLTKTPDCSILIDGARAYIQTKKLPQQKILVFTSASQSVADEENKKKTAAYFYITDKELLF